MRAHEHLIVREGYGTGEALAATLGEAHERAIKTAEIDATKRALATFGKPFGLALYGGSKGRPSPSRRPEIVRRRTAQRLGGNSRYQVVPPPRPNPSHATTMLAQLDQGREPSEATEGESSGPLASHPAEAPVDDEARPVSEGLLIERPRRRRDCDHLRFVANQPCLVCSRVPSDAHHLKFVQPQAMSKKVSDEYAVPACRIHHRQLHHSGDEVAWWIDREIDPLQISKDLWSQSRMKHDGGS